METLTFSEVNPDPNKCKILSCNKKHHSKGYCKYHYYAIRRSGINNTFIVIVGFLNSNKDALIADILPRVKEMTKEPLIYGHFDTSWRKSRK